MEVVGALVGSLASCCLGLMVKPLIRRIGAFVNLEKNRGSLDANASDLDARAHEIKHMIHVRCFEPPYEYKMTEQAMELTAWLSDFREEFGKLPRRRNNTIKDIVSNYKLGIKVIKLIEKAENLSREIPELDSLVIEDVNAKYLYYRSTKLDGLLQKYEKLKCKKEKMVENIKGMLSLLPHRIQSNIASSWLESVDDFVKKVNGVRDSFVQMDDKSDSECRVDIEEVDQLMEKATTLLEDGCRELVMIDFNSKKLDDLLQEFKKLNCMKVGMKDRVREILSGREGPYDCLSYETSSWLNSVDDFAKKVTSDSMRMIGVEEFDELLKKARELLEEGSSLLSAEAKVLTRKPSTTGKHIPLYSQEAVHEDEFSKVKHLIDEGGAKNIAISGMGGIGKTNLLKKINNHYCGGGGFNIVAYVDVGREKDVQTIQRELCKKLLIDQNLKWMDEILWKYLNERNFLLLMDDVWDSLKLEEIGIPISNSGVTESERKSKVVVITTRSGSVCNELGIAKKMRVEMKSLDDDKSWRLFLSSLGKGDDPPSVHLPRQARDVAKYCGGLPLALVTIARAMMGKVSPMEWNDAKMELEQAALASKGMDKVFSSLKFSFDRLKNDGLREILLYCSLYPQDHNIFVEDLTDLLIGEGFIPSTILDKIPENVQARTRGMIDDLVEVSLLIQETEETVKLHDCVRDMAVWLTDGKNYRSELFLRCSPLADPKRLPPAKRVSMLYGNESSIPAAPGDPEKDGVDNPPLQTLLWEMRNIDRIPADVFTSMRNVRVLNLSNSSIKEIDASIGCLLHLRYLNLQSTLIERLPEELGNLTELRQLILRYTLSLYHIPRESLCRLHKLEKLDMFGSVYIWRWYHSLTARKKKEAESHGIGAMTLHDLNELAEKRKLSDVSIQWNGKDLPRHYYVIFPMPVNQEYHILRSIIHMELHSSGESNIRIQPELFAILSDRIQTLAVRDFRICSTRSNERFPSLRDLSLSSIELVGLPYSDDSFPMLSNVSLANCPEIEDLEWLRSAGYLKVLKVENCQRLQSLLPSVSDFPYLKELRLVGCQSLERIHNNDSLLLPSLESLYVRDCANLKELPFNNEGAAPKLASIRGSNEWWESLQWELKDKFSRHFSPF